MLNLSMGDRWLMRAAGLAFISLLSILSYEAWRNGEANARTETQLSSSLATLNSTIEFINRPCNAKDAHGQQLAKGTLCTFDELARDVSNATAATQKQVMQSGQLVQATANSLTSAAADLHTTATTLNSQVSQVGPLLTSLTKTSDAIPATMTKVNAALEPMPDLTRNLAALTGDLDARVKDPNNAALQKNLTATAGNLALISGDFYARLHPLLNPDPCTTRSCRAKQAFGKVSATFPLLEAVYDIQRIWAGPNQNVKVALSGTPTPRPAKTMESNSKKGGRN